MKITQLNKMNLLRNTVLFFLSLSFIVCSENVLAQSTEYDSLKVLLVTAHPDDDALFSGTVYRLTHHFGAKVDLLLVTNGEGGYKYSTLGNQIYGLELDKEEIGRTYLPGIRKMELMNGGKIVGINNYFFLDEPDVRYTQDVEEVFATHWDTAYIKERMKSILQKGQYDLVFTMLVSPTTHGHHKGSALLMMESIMEGEIIDKPFLMMGTIYGKYYPPQIYSGFAGYPLTSVSDTTRFVEFNRMTPFGYNNRLNYQIIANWVIAEHKSQGTMQLLMSRGEVERYWIPDFNESEKKPFVDTLFKKLNIPWKSLEK